MHLSPEMWRMLPALWVIGLVGIGFGLPLMIGRVRPNPYYGLQIGSGGERDDVWYPMNALIGRGLALAGARFIVLTSVLANLGWRQPLHYLIACGCILAAEVMLLDGRWRRIGDAALKRIDEAERTEHAARSSGPDHGAW